MNLGSLEGRCVRNKLRNAFLEIKKSGTLLKIASIAAELFRKIVDFKFVDFKIIFYLFWLRIFA